MDSKKKNKKPTYEKPILKKHGDLKDITARSSSGQPPAPAAPSSPV